MRSKHAAAAVTLALVAAIAGCGESTPKRAVDARTEVLRFFASDAPVVGLLRLGQPADLLRLNRAAAGSATWTDLRHLVLGPLHGAGLDAVDLARLVRPVQPIEGLDTSALALGAPSAAALAVGQPLLVLATDQSQLLSRLLHRSAASGRLRPAGSVDQAALYRGRDSSFAVRDGVLVSAPRLVDVRAAIERRDGDRDQQLDDHEVESLFDELDTQGPLLAYANFAALRDADPGLATLATDNPWIEAADRGAAAARARGRFVRIVMIVKMSRSLDPAQLPFGERPSRFDLPFAAVPFLVPHRSDLLHVALRGTTPISGWGTASANEVRADAYVGR